MCERLGIQRCCSRGGGSFHINRFPPVPVQMIIVVLVLDLFCGSSDIVGGVETQIAFPGSDWGDQGLEIQREAFSTHVLYYD